MLKIRGLTTEYLENPIGIDAKSPRFSWKLESDKRDVMQSAYQIICSSNGRTIWDSGKVKSDQSVAVRYAGEALKSAQLVEWKVTVWVDEDKAESKIASFEMGLLSLDDWEAKWIEPEGEVDPDKLLPAPYLRKKFKVKPGLVKARIYQTAHGLYEFWLNGKVGTEDKFKPGFTSYYHRIQYQTYDVTRLLTEGENIWSVKLGDGWWRGLCGGINRNNFGYKLHFLGQLVLEYADGTREVVVSDEEFRWTTGGLRLSDMKAGDIYDARMEPDGWKTVGFDDSAWEHVHLAEEVHCDNKLLIPSRSVPVLEKEKLNPQIIRDTNGDLILDFGQNIAGYVKMKLRGCKKGQEVILIHGEDMKDGAFSVGNICMGMVLEERIQQVNYIAAGRDIEEYCPEFSIFGFRYVKVTGYEGEIKEGDFIAVAVYSANKETGEFTCSNSFVNKLVSNSRWSQKGNFMDVPTDCPTRERSPWTGDAQAYCRTAADFMNVYPFFEKWMQDLNYEQLESGKILNTFPSTNIRQNAAECKRQVDMLLAAGADPNDQMVMMAFGNMEKGGPVDGSAGWSDAAVIIPYTMYLCYGDKQILENQYESAKKHVNYMFQCAKDKNEYRKDAPEYHNDTDGEPDGNYIWDTRYHWGEWLEADSNLEIEMAQLEKKKVNPDPEVPTAFMCYGAQLLSRIAKILGKEEDAEKYAELATKVKSVMNKYMIHPDGTIKVGRQAPNVRALAFHLCEEDREQKTADRLAEMVKENTYHLNTGFLATPYILNVLSDYGHADTAYKLLEQETAPSWLYNVAHGATTILEEWNGMRDHTGSYNHYSYGAVCNFLFSRVCGIQPLPETPGYKKFLIQPVPGGTFSYADAAYESLYGTIESEWGRKGEEITYDFRIPANTTAVVRLTANETDVEKVKKQYPKAKYADHCIEFEIGSGNWSVVL